MKQIITNFLNDVDLSITKENSKLFSIHRLTGLSKNFVSVDGNIYDTQNFIKNLNRDEKINKLLDEK